MFFFLWIQKLTQIRMQVIRISNDLANADKKPMIWVDGGIHAREWIASHTVMYIINALLSELENDLKSQVVF